MKSITKQSIDRSFCPSKKRWPWHSSRLVAAGKLMQVAGVALAVSGCAMQPSLQPDMLSEIPQSMPMGNSADAEAALIPALPLPNAAALNQLLPTPTQQSARAGHSQQHAQRKIDVDVRQMPAQQFFLGLMQSSGKNVVIDPSVDGLITLSLRQVTVEQVLQAIEDNYGISWDRQPYGYRVEKQDLQVYVFNVDYLNLQRAGRSQMRVSSGQVSERSKSELSGSDNGRSFHDDRSDDQRGSGSRIVTESNSDVWTDLEQNIALLLAEKPGRTVTVNPQAGLVIVRALPGELKYIASYLQQMHGSLHRQVILEAKVLEVELRDEFQTGINWAALGRPRSGGGTVTGGLTGTGGVLGQAGSLLGSNGLNTPSALANSSFSGMFSLAFNFSDFTGFIELLEGQGKVQVLSSPRVATVNNQKAIIKVGRDEFFVTDVSSTTITSAATQSVTPNIELTPFFSGIALDVTPQIGADNVVTLHVHPTVSEVRDATKLITVGDQQQAIPVAVSSIRESDSIVRARSGQVVVIGGLMQASADNSQSGLPGISRAPGIGNLFKHQSQTSVKKELVILLRPIVVEADGWDAQVQDVRRRFQSMPNRNSGGLGF